MLISFSKAIVSDSPLLRNLHSQSLDSAFDETEKQKSFQCESNLIRDQQIQHFCKSITSNRKILSFSHSRFLWFWAFQGNQQCTCSHDKQQDSIDMLHSLTYKDMQSLHSDAIRSSCLSEWTSVLRRLQRPGTINLCHF